MTGVRAILAGLCLLPINAWATEISGRLKLEETVFNAGDHTIEQALGNQTTKQLAGQVRVAVAREFSRWRLRGAVQLDGRDGSEVQRELAIAANYPALAQTRPADNYWDLEHTYAYGGRTQITGRVDRLNLSWTGDRLVVRVGRQALTWGSGLVFHPMDLVNPFQPVATDTIYKRGTDMAYAQWLFKNGADIQFAGVFRRRREGEPGSGQNTWATFADIAGDTAQWTLLLARNRSDSVVGVGLSHALGSAVWNGEVVTTHTSLDGNVTSALSNISWATVWHGHNVTLFAEYYRNGFGEARSGYTASEIPAGLSVRLRRGDVFVTGRDYLALGSTWELTPLLQLAPTVIVNLHDRSSLIDLQATWSLSNDTLLKGGLRVAAGAHGTELRGLELVPSSDVYLASPDQAFLRVEHYFQAR